MLHIKHLERLTSGHHPRLVLSRYSMINLRMIIQKWMKKEPTEGEEALLLGVGKVAEDQFWRWKAYWQEHGFGVRGIWIESQLS